MCVTVSVLSSQFSVSVCGVRGRAIKEPRNDARRPRYRRTLPISDVLANEVVAQVLDDDVAVSRRDTLSVNADDEGGDGLLDRATVGALLAPQAVGRSADRDELEVADLDSARSERTLFDTTRRGRTRWVSTMGRRTSKAHARSACHTYRVQVSRHENLDLISGERREGGRLRPDPAVLPEDRGRRELAAVRKIDHEVVVDVGLPAHLSFGCW